MLFLAASIRWGALTAEMAVQSSCCIWGYPDCASARKSQRGSKYPHSRNAVVKTWPLVIIDSATPQEVEHLKKRFTGELSFPRALAGRFSLLADVS